MMRVFTVKNVGSFLLKDSNASGDVTFVVKKLIKRLFNH